MGQRRQSAENRGGSTVGRGGIAFLFIWIGVWAAATFMAACFALGLLKAWRSKPSA